MRTMFTNQHHLEHLIAPRSNTTPRSSINSNYATCSIRHGTRCCTVHDLAKPGDFRTYNVCGTPVLLRNFEGELRAFLNVCPHRHTTLTDKPCGNTEKLRCQYHAWEFTKDGTTGKIPDAKSFRPWDRENSCLKKFHIDRCADLVFVNLSGQSGVTERLDWPVVGTVAGFLGGDYRYSCTWEKEFPCNWKIVVENSLESYHIPEVHPMTFREYPPEENAWHELHENYTTFRTMTPRDKAGHAMDWMARRLGREPKGEYWHRVLHPHATGSVLDVTRTMQCVFPTGPNKSLYRTMYFTLRGSTKGPLAWSIYKLLELLGTQITRKVFAEDGSIYPSVQRGLEASAHRGVIGTQRTDLPLAQVHSGPNTRR